MKNWTDERLIYILNLHKEGMRQCEIAKLLFVTRERARQILLKADRDERYKEARKEALQAFEKKHYLVLALQSILSNGVSNENNR